MAAPTNKMASVMKIKFAGILRGWLGQGDKPEPVRPVASNAASTPPPSLTGSPPPAAATGDIAIPLAPVIAALPMDLKAKLGSPLPAGQTIRVGVETVVSQLAFGAVKISFGELRAQVPGLFTHAGSEHDDRPVNLPLREILPLINPALLARRTVEKVEVDESVAGPFGGRGRGVTFTTHPLKPAAVTPPAAEAPSVPARTITPTPISNTEIFTYTPRQTAPAAAPIQFAPPATPSGNGNSNGHSNGHSNGNGQANGQSNGNGQANGNGKTVLPPFKFTAAPVSAESASSPPPSEAAQPPLLISLDKLAEHWPDDLRVEIQRLNLANTSVPLPASIVEPGLKRGRVVMTWKTLRTLVHPGSAPSPNDGLELELPLKVLAPVFLAAQKTSARVQAKVLVPEGIPNLFFGFPQSAPETPAPTAPVAPVARMASAPLAPRPVDTNFYVWGENGEVPLTDEQSLKRAVTPPTDFLSRQTHPQEIVTRAMALNGVAGAVVALADGLRVASQVPKDMNADAIAAFLPQIFERVNQSTRELRMGALNNVGFTVGNAPWKIFRVNSVYLAAFGRAGESLPKSQLAALAAELERKKQQ